MVHALSEIRRVLVNGGILIDLRPLQDRWKVEVVSARQSFETGNLAGLQGPIEDDRAANRALEYATREGWFLREREESFLYEYSWDTPGEMEEWLEQEWEHLLVLDEDTRRATRSAWTRSDADARVCLQVRLSISRWKVQKDM
jgi:SAM-dependent methyltransferase